MRRMLIGLCLALAAWSALPAQAEDEDARELRRLRDENVHLKAALERMKTESTRLANATQDLSTALADFRTKYTRLTGELAILQATMDRELQALRAEVRQKDRRRVQLELFLSDREGELRNLHEILETRSSEAERRLATCEKELTEVRGRATVCEHVLREERATRDVYYGSLFAAIGEEAVAPIIARLVEDPAAHAARLCPLLGRMGAVARTAIPPLREVARDEALHRQGAGRHADEAIAAIRAAMRAADEPADK
jgi:DNA repair exonuclease SbcCD ATPase subunit